MRARDHFRRSFTIQVLNCKGMSHSIKMRVDDMAKLIAGAGHQLRNLQVLFAGPFSYLYVSFIGLFRGGHSHVIDMSKLVAGTGHRLRNLQVSFLGLFFTCTTL